MFPACECDFCSVGLRDVLFLSVQVVGVEASVCAWVLVWLVQNTNTHAHIYMYACMHTHAHICMHAHTHRHTHAHTHTHLRTLICARAHTHTHTHTNHKLSLASPPSTITTSTPTLHISQNSLHCHTWQIYEKVALHLLLLFFCCFLKYLTCNL